MKWLNSGTVSAMRSPESPKSQPRQSPLLTKNPVPHENSAPMRPAESTPNGSVTSPQACLTRIASCSELKPPSGDNAVCVASAKLEYEGRTSGVDPKPTL